MLPHWFGAAPLGRGKKKRHLLCQSCGPVEMHGANLLDACYKVKGHVIFQHCVVTG